MNKTNMHIRLLSLLLLGILFSGCAVPANRDVVDNSASQLQLRQLQSRYFETSDKKKAMEAVLSTLQDLGFVIDKASYDLGTVSATKLSGYYMRMTVSVIKKGEAQMAVRASAQYNQRPVTDGAAYQSFFEALSKAMFLQANIDE